MDVEELGVRLVEVERGPIGRLLAVGWIFGWTGFEWSDELAEKSTTSSF